MGRIPASHDVFRAIADPGRRRILDALRDRERTVGELTTLLALGQPTVSEHLRVLRDAGLVADRAAGRNRLYRLEPAVLRTVSDWVAPFEAFWSDRLDALEAHLARRKN